MEPALAAQALAQASSSMTRPHDVVGALGALLRNCQQGLDVEACGILIESGGRLELLASSSHRAAELELHQLHAGEGPCVDAHRTAASVQAASSADITARWPAFSETMLSAGFRSVHAAPLAFEGSPIGAMGLFRSSDEPFTPEEDVVAQAFADIATMLVFHVSGIAPERLTERLRAALGERVLVEQAKGVLADTHDVSMAEAFDLLDAGARDGQQDLAVWASRVISEAQTAR